MPNDTRELPATQDGVHRFLGGSPLAVAFRLILLSILVGVVLAAIGFDPWNILTSIELLFRRIYDLGFFEDVLSLSDVYRDIALLEGHLVHLRHLSSNRTDSLRYRCQVHRHPPLTVYFEPSRFESRRPLRKARRRLRRTRYVHDESFVLGSMVQQVQHRWLARRAART